MVVALLKEEPNNVKSICEDAEALGMDRLSCKMGQGLASS